MTSGDGRCYDPVVPDPIADPECPRCGGRGWLRVADGGAGSAIPCSCRASRLGPLREEAASIPARFAECSFDSFATHGTEGEHLLRAKKQCEAFIDDFFSLDGNQVERGLLLIGIPGVGKTHLAVAVLRKLIARGLHGRFLDFSAFLSRLQASFDPTSEESRHRLLDPILGAEVLLFDDLGAQRPSPFVQDILYLIINTRYSEKRTTLFTTNFRLRASGAARTAQAKMRMDAPQPWIVEGRPESEVDLLTDRLPPRLVSRVCEMARPILIQGRDRRLAPVGLG